MQKQNSWNIFSKEKGKVVPDVATARLYFIASN